MTKGCKRSIGFLYSLLIMTISIISFHQVNVPTPDYSGRRDILNLYLGRVLTGGDLDVELLARGTTGFTGADLESMVNQAALK